MPASHVDQIQKENPIEQSQTENPAKILFEKICDLARNKDENGLRKLISSGVSINIYFGLVNPVAQLAHEGEHDAVNLLLDKFGADPNTAAWGYARRGDKEKVNQLIQEEGLTLNSAIYGYLIGCSDYRKSKDEMKAKDLLKEAEVLLKEETEKNNHDVLKHAAMGYAYLGEEKRVNELVAQAANDDRGMIIEAVAWMYGYCGSDYKLVDALISQHVNMRDKAHGFYINGLALAGHSQQLDSFIKEWSDENNALEGFAIACDIANVRKLFSANLNIEDTLIRVKRSISGFAHAGYAEEVNELLALYNSSDLMLTAVETYAFCHHFAPMEDLLKKACNVRMVESSIKPYFANEKRALRTLSFIQDDKIRADLAQMTNVKNLLPRATIIHRLMTNKQLDYKECLAMTDLTPAQREAASKPEVQTWLLECLKLIKGNDKRPGLPLELFLSVVDYLSPMTSWERNDLWAKYLNYGQLYPNLATSYASLFSQSKERSFVEKFTESTINNNCTPNPR